MFFYYEELTDFVQFVLQFIHSHQEILQYTCIFCKMGVTQL